MPEAFNEVSNDTDVPFSGEKFIKKIKIDETALTGKFIKIPDLMSHDFIMKHKNTLDTREFRNYIMHCARTIK